MRSGEVADRAGVKVGTLRYYERRGLVARPPRSSSGYRVYPGGAVKVVRFVKRAQELGFTLDEVEELLGLVDGGPEQCESARVVATARVSELERRIDDLARMRDSLSVLVATCDRPRADRRCTAGCAGLQSRRGVVRLEILHVPGCPNVAVLEHRLDQALGNAPEKPERTSRVVEDIETATALGMTGSPTLLVDGLDPFAEPGLAPAVSCRLYRDEVGRMQGAPSVPALRHALGVPDVDGPGDATTAQTPDCCAPGSTLRMWRRWAAPRDPAQRAVHQAILRAFAATGAPPAARELNRVASSFGVPVGQVLDLLHAADVVRLGPDGRVAAAYPFSAVPTRHRLRLRGGVEVFAMCVIDALGMPAMLGTDAVITTVDPVGGERITVTVQDGAAQWEPVSAVVFVGAAAGGGASADSCCDFLNAFIDRDRAEAWARAQREITGEVVTAEQAEKLGQAIFADLLANEA